MNEIKATNNDLVVGQATSVQQTQRNQEVSEGASTPVAKPEVGQAERANVEAQELASSVEEAVANLNEYVQSVQRDLQFRLDDQSGKTVITVLDRSTEEVVRQIPDDVVLRLARNLQQDEPISLFNTKV
jgi:flagellar protein FlaG